LEETEPDDAEYAAKVKALQQRVEHHVKEEEGEMFPNAEKLLGERNSSPSVRKSRRSKKNSGRSEGKGHGHPSSVKNPNIRKAKPRVKMSIIEKSIDINVPEHTAYNQWTQFEDFSKFMEGVIEVRQWTTNTSTGARKSAVLKRVLRRR